MKLKKILALCVTVSMMSAAVVVSAEGENASKGTPEPTQTAQPEGSPEPTQTAQPEMKLLSPEYRIFEQVAGYAADYYIDDSKTREEVMQDALSEVLNGNDALLVELLKASFSTLDQYSRFYTAEEYQAVMANENKTFYGIGTHLQEVDGYVTIVGFEESSAAKDAGIMEGDKIVKVDDTDVTGWSAVDARNIIVADVESNVKITVLRDGEELTFDITRQFAGYKATVSYEKYSDDIALMRVSSISLNTANEFKEALDQAEADGIKKIVLDLRDNPGGYVEIAAEMAKLIVPEGVIAQAEYRNPKYNTTYSSELKEKRFDFNVLINGNTASAAEILASAIQESGTGKLIGTITYGKALIQRFYPLTNGSAFKVTSGEYKTRNGSRINGIGIYPDEEVTNIVKYIDSTQFTPFDYKTKWALGDSGTGVEAGKIRLRLLQYYTGTLNDQFDKSFELAVSKFQEDNGLYAYGVMDITTQHKINDKFCELQVEEDIQQKTAIEDFGGTTALSDESSLGSAA